MVLYKFIVLLITIEIVFSGSIYKDFDDYINRELKYKSVKRNEMANTLLDSLFPAEKRGVALYGRDTWPNGVIPYDLSEISSSDHRTIIKEAMQMIMDDTYKDGAYCIQFRPKLQKDQDILKFQYGDGCTSNQIGYISGKSPTISLTDNCFKYKYIQHELMHVIGFHHEHKRPDRDDYITIDYEHINPKKVNEAEKLVWGETALDLGTSYDYYSIMHYGPYAMNSEGNSYQIITPLQSDVSIGTATRLSETDVLEVQLLYNCNT